MTVLARTRLRSSRCAERGEPRCRVRAVGQLRERFVVSPAAETEQLRLREVRCGDEHTRTDRRRDAGVARHVHERADDRELGVPEAERVANACLERDQQRLIHERVSTALELRPSTRRRRRDSPVERIFRRHGAHLHETRTAAPLDESHRGERSLAGESNPGVPQRVEKRVGLWREVALARPEGDVAAEQRAGLFADGLGDVRRERIDRDERRDA